MFFQGQGRDFGDGVLDVSWGDSHGVVIIVGFLQEQEDGLDEEMVNLARVAVAGPMNERDNTCF